MDSLVKNVLYLSPSAGLALAGIGCLWLLTNTSNIVLQIIYLLFGVFLFIRSYDLGKYGFDSLERIKCQEAKARMRIEKERTKRVSKKHEAEIQKIQSRRELEREKVETGKERLGQNIIRILLKGR
jgi:hypothetical protein